MKRVHMTVRITTEVPDDTDPDALCLELPVDGCSVTDMTGDEVGRVEEYETIKVEPVAEEEGDDVASE